MIEAYQEFFTSSTDASAAFMGLLFVSISLIESRQADEATQTWRRIIASSSFAQLIDIFFVSIASLLPNPESSVIAGIIMSILGLSVSLLLLPKVIRGRRLPSSLGLVAVGAYLIQFITAVGLLVNPGNQVLLDCFILAILILYFGALARAWEISGIKKR